MKLDIDSGKGSGEGTFVSRIFVIFPRVTNVTSFFRAECNNARTCSGYTSRFRSGISWHKSARTVGRMNISGRSPRLPVQQFFGQINSINGQEYKCEGRDHQKHFLGYACSWIMHPFSNFVARYVDCSSLIVRMLIQRLQEPAYIVFVRFLVCLVLLWLKKGVIS